MTNAQKALMEMANHPDPFVASATLEAIWRTLRPVGIASDAENESLAEAVEKNTHGMVNGTQWVGAMKIAYDIADKATNPNKH